MTRFLNGLDQVARRPRHYQVCGQAGPLGWDIPAAIRRVEKTQPDAEVVAVIGDYSFQFLVQELAVAAQYDVPFVLIMLIMLINEYLGLIRQAERGYAMNYQVDLHYDQHGTDIVKIMTAYGCTGTRVVEPAVVDPVGAQGGRAHQQTGARGNHDRAHRKRRHGHFAG